MSCLGLALCECRRPDVSEDCRADCPSGFAASIIRIVSLSDVKGIDVTCKLPNPPSSGSS